MQNELCWGHGSCSILPWNDVRLFCDETVESRDGFFFGFTDGGGEGFRCLLLCCNRRQ